jgi:hypothetical protein
MNWWIKWNSKIYTAGKLIKTLFPI